ncbi:MAG: ABC transporter ATP-binding protein [Planctomycetota bacterium]
METAQSDKRTILTVEDLRVHFELDQGTVRAVDGVTFSVLQGEIVGLIGESGCGKTVTAQAVMRIVPSPGRIASGSIRLYRDGAERESVDIATLSGHGEEVRRIRGGEISMIFQEPMTSFSPVHTVGNQITEAIRLHRDMDKPHARDLTIEMLARVGIPKAAQRFDAYPFQLSGGMRQRAMIAMALSTRPRLLIADEPTTALDVTIQAQILELMKALQAEFGMAILLITHNLGVVAEVCRHVAVMYLGRIVETAEVGPLFENPLHPYTKALMDSIPKISQRVGKLKVIRGSVPDPFAKLPGCPFFPRCDFAMSGKCDVGGPPSLFEVRPGHRAACLLYEQSTEARMP